MRERRTLTVHALTVCVPPPPPVIRPQVMSGNGTVAVEVLEALRTLGGGAAPDAATVYCCCGGGGMISGIAAYLKVHAPAWLVVGCQPDASPVMSVSVNAGRVVHMESLPTLSDGSAGGLEDGACPLQHGVR
jgi:threonine dehydratase